MEHKIAAQREQKDERKKKKGSKEITRKGPVELKKYNTDRKEQKRKRKWNRENTEQEKESIW